MSGKLKKVFPGGNTSEGFFSYYEYLLAKGSKRVFVIKGGPGVGKSTLMKKIGQKMLELGYHLEFHYCSSDNKSLDGIAIPDAGIVMVDGTKPHLLDPKYPGGIGEIINLGEYWDHEAMQVNRDKIIASTQEVSRLFARGYRFLSAARAIAENICALHRESMDFASMNKVLGLFDKVLLKHTYSTEEYASVGKERHLFSCAYTPEGFIDLTDSILQNIRKVYFLDGGMGTGKTTLMSKIAARATEKGLDVEIYHTPLIPEKIGTVLIEEINMAITTSEKYRKNNYEPINLNEFLDKSLMANFQKDIQDDQQILENLLAKGIECIYQAKQEHDVLEQYYVPNMNFAAANEKSEEILKRIIKLAE
jgi:hypothetical protein